MGYFINKILKSYIKKNTFIFAFASLLQFQKKPLEGRHVIQTLNSEGLFCPFLKIKKQQR